MSWLKDLKSQCNILDVARQYMKIEKISDGKAVVKCPFHHDKTPSCHLNAKNNMFYCFGCQAGGDVIKFVEKIENINFIEASHKIASMYGFTIPKHNMPQDKYFHTLNEICFWAHKKLLENQKVMTYILGRGLEQKTLSDFLIGYLDHDLQKFCHKNNISDADLCDIGLDNKILYLMKQRIIFPIFKNGVPVAIAGRCLSEHPHIAKYINISETKHFQKKQTMYWHPHFERRHYTREIYLVEGYIDVCICEQNGLAAAATMGTACSVNHVIKLWQYCDNVVVLFDGDIPGQKAASKLSIEIIEHIRPGKQIMFGYLPNNTDPAEFLLKNTRDSIQNLSLVEKIWHDVNPKSNLSLEHRVAAYQSIISMIDKIQNRDLQYLYKREFAKLWYAKKKEDNPLHVPLMSAKYKQEFILIAMVIYFPNILYDVFEYFMYIKTTENLENIHAQIVDNFQREESMPTFLRDEISFDQLQQSAPFLKSDLSHDDIVRIWFDIFDFYTKKVSNKI